VDSDPPSEKHLMDMLRAVATGVAEWATRSRPSLSPRLKRLRLDVEERESQRGQGLGEYALILALIAIIAIVSLSFLGNTITDLFWAPIDEEFGKILSRLGI
jgi:Flp pilus assembly pilin Flp